MTFGLLTAGMLGYHSKLQVFLRETNKVMQYTAGLVGWHEQRCKGVKRLLTD